MTQRTYEETSYAINQTIRIIDENSAYRQAKINPPSKPFAPFDILYTSATENIKEYSEEFKSPKKVLTSCGSGDHILNALSMGASEILCFDLNYLAKYALELKLAAVLALTPGEYRVFYKEFPTNLLVRTLQYMSEEAEMYWRQVFLYAEGFIKPDLFGYQELDDETIKRINLFSNKQKYIQLKEQIKKAKFDFIQCELYDLTNIISTDKFDMINLSNIYEYINGGMRLSQTQANKYYEFIQSLKENNLTPNGEMLVSYFYNYNEQVRNYIQGLIRTKLEMLPITGITNPEQQELYNNGFTMQKVAYNYLLDIIGESIIRKEITSVDARYGESFDKSKDMALILKK